jgi:hypothetical protein
MRAVLTNASSLEARRAAHRVQLQKGGSTPMNPHVTARFGSSRPTTRHVCRVTTSARADGERWTIWQPAEFGWGMNEMLSGGAGSV